MAVFAWTVADNATVGPFSHNQRISWLTDAMTAGTNTYTITGFDIEKPHVFMFIRMFNSGGTEIATDAGASAQVVVTIRPADTAWYESPADDTITGVAPSTIDWEGPTEAFKFVISGTWATATTIKAEIVMFRN